MDASISDTCSHLEEQVEILRVGFIRKSMKTVRFRVQYYMYILLYVHSLSVIVLYIGTKKSIYIYIYNIKFTGGWWT